MKLMRWLLVVVLAVALCAGMGETKGRRRAATRPRGAALVAEADPAWLSPVAVIGGYAATRGWVGSAEAKGLMREGDRLSLYTLRRGRVGSARLTDNGYDLSRWNSVSPPSSWEGLGYGARLRFTDGRGKTGSGETVLAVWHASGSPEPRWICATVLTPTNRTYRDAILQWLRERGVSREPERGVLTVHQIVRADLNRDRQDEVLLSFSWYEDRPAWSPEPDQQARRGAGGVLMRYLPRGSGRPRTVVLLDSSDLRYAVIGICDLDRDGWGEVAVSDVGAEGGGTSLCHWTGNRFEYVSGHSGGE